MKVLLSLSSLLTLTSSSSNNNINGNLNDDETTIYPSSCKGLSDGYYMLQLLDPSSSNTEELSSSYPLIWAKCSNEYMILDYNLDPDISNYFSSWIAWYSHHHGPSNSEHINWHEWYLPARQVYTSSSTISSSSSSSSSSIKKLDTDTDDFFEFLTSPDCDVCEADSPQNTVYDTDSAYWMTGSIFGCFWKNKGTTSLDQKWDDSETCYYYSSRVTHLIGTTSNRMVNIMNDYDQTASETWTGTCSHTVGSAQTDIYASHYDCWDDKYDDGSKGHYKPSLGTNGKYCVCVKPSESFQTTFEVKKSAREEKTFLKDYESSNKNENENEKDEMNENSKNSEKEYLLYQKDFEKGTLRITESGKYTIMEDIVFEFGKDNEYYPSDDVYDLYPGSNEFRGEFSQGFFAGITIESDDVELDLNGFELKMDEMFYYQQRWFTVIEIGSQYFLPGQGFYFSGATPKFSSNIIIKNGIIGLTSHHGIHGNGNKNVLIENLKIHNFESHGIQLNGFTKLSLKSLDIGPSSSKALLNGYYAHARGNLRRFRQFAQDSDYSDRKLQFYGRDEYVTMQDIVDELEIQLDYALNYIINGETYNDDPSFTAAIDTFVNGVDGDPFGASQYGIFLNGFGASTLTYDLISADNALSSDAEIINVKVHGLSHKMWVRHPINTVVSLVGPLNMIYDAETMFHNFNNWEDRELGFTYKGNILFDAGLFMGAITDNWDYLGSQKTDWLVDFAFGNGFSQDEISNGPNGKEVLKIHCNSDIMFHSGKGTQGIRIDSVDGVNLNNVEVYDNHDYTQLEETICGGDDTVKTWSMCIYTDTSQTSDDCENDENGLIKSDIQIGMYPHALANKPMQHGFSGNMNQGIVLNVATNVIIEDVKVYDLSSESGPVYGISMWPNDVIELKGDIIVKNLNAGYGVEKDLYDYNDSPNYAAEACAVRDYRDYDEYVSAVSVETARFDTECIKGNTGCMGEEWMLTMFGENVKTCDAAAASKDESKNMRKQKIEEKNEMNVKKGMNWKFDGNTEKVIFVLLGCGLIVMFAVCMFGCKLNSINNNEKNGLRNDFVRYNEYSSLLP